jgi:5'-3' exonuclease
MSGSDKQVYLIDASIYVFRAWFSLPSSLLGSEQQPINAAYGFTRFLTEFLESSEATHVVIAFDESLTKSFRNEIYPQYKMNRELPPAELKAQFKLCRRVAEAAGFYCVAHERYEADDLIGTAAHKMRQLDYQVTVVSGDKDLTQVLEEQDTFWDFARKQRLNSQQVAEKFGVGPSAIPDYLGLCGDAVDNIPGVPGVGPKTASALLQEYPSMEDIWPNIENVADLPIRGAKKLGEKLALHREQAELSKLLATIAIDAPIEVNESAARRKQAEMAEFRQLVEIFDGRGDGLFQRMARQY